MHRYCVLRCTQCENRGTRLVVTVDVPLVVAVADSVDVPVDVTLADCVDDCVVDTDSDWLDVAEDDTDDVAVDVAVVLSHAMKSPSL